MREGDSHIKGKRETLQINVMIRQPMNGVSDWNVMVTKICNHQLKGMYHWGLTW